MTDTSKPRRNIAGWIGLVLVCAVLGMMTAWGVLAVNWSPLPAPLGFLLSAAYGGGALAAAIWLRRWKPLPLLYIAAWGAALASFLSISPSNDRDWSVDQEVLPWATFNGPTVTIRNVRNFSYRSVDDYTPGYDTRTVTLDGLETVEFVLEHFPGVPGAAHTLLTFGFSDGQRVAISVEIRKEKGETYNPLAGLFRQYELMYVIADERDVIRLRTNHRKNEVYLYPVRTDRERMRNLFLSMVRRANRLSETPEFYNTLTSTCTTNLVDHVNELVPDRIPFSLDALLPANADHLAYDLDLIDTDLPFGKIRAHFRIDEKARAADVDAFPGAIRAGR